MKRRLKEELQQTRPFASLEEEVFLEIQRTSQVTARWVFEALRERDLTPSQFNVLRILRGAGPDGLACGRIAERMVAHDPDLTRLLDRLEGAGFVEKDRDVLDRRVVVTRITQHGLAAVEAASRHVTERLQGGLKAVPRKKLEQLADLLETVRAGGEHGQDQGSRSGHGSDRKAGRSDRARAAGEGRARAGDDAAPRGRRGEGARGARRRSGQG